MRDWTKLLLIVCVVALGAGMFVLERRVSGLEAELRAARSELAGHQSVNPVRVAFNEVPAPRAWELETPGNSAVRPLQPAPQPRIERQPSGVINGIPYYFVPLSQQ